MTNRNRPAPSLHTVAAAAAVIVVVSAGIFIASRPPADGHVAAVGSPTSSLTAASIAADQSTAPATTSPAVAQSAAPPSQPDSTPSGARGPFEAGILIADRANGRLLAIDNGGSILWQFPTSKADLPAGQAFNADDAFIDPNGRSIVANDETHNVIDRIDIATGKVIWQYGIYGHAGASLPHLHTPDDAYPLANGNIVVADIENCRILEIAPDKSIARQWGKTGNCRHQAGVTFNRPNGDTPLPDGGILITEIGGSRVVRLAADGSVIFDIHIPVAYPSDAQLDAKGNIVIADYSSHGQVVSVDPTGKLVWRYAPVSGPGALNHPSLATPMANGLVAVNDDNRNRVVVIDPVAGRIVWQYGTTDRRGSAAGFLYDPDGHQPFAAGIFR